MEAFKEVKRKDWTLVYNPEFEQYRDKYKNIVSKVKSVLEGDAVEGVEVELIKKTSNDKSYFQLSIGEEIFFVKKIPNHGDQGGVEEFKSAQKARERLSENGFDNVKIIDYIFAYSDSGYRYVVSRYKNVLHTTLEDFINNLKKKSESTEIDKLNERFESIKNILNEFWDVSLGNMAYDIESGDIVLFDLNITGRVLSKSSDDEL